jgi:predicted nucleic acid-binding protein
MSENTEHRPLSIEETAELLGAEICGDVGPIASDPIGLKLLAARVAARLVSKGGRPSDESWRVVRKVPMKEETWAALQAISERLAEEGIRVSPGQLAAMALEEGLPLLESKTRRKQAKTPQGSGQSAYIFSKESRDEAARLYSVREHEEFWAQCA